MSCVLVTRQIHKTPPILKLTHNFEARIRIAALNNSWSGDGTQSNDSLRGQSTKEAKEAEAYALYNKALTFLRNGKSDEAEETFRDLIDHDFLVEAYDMLEERSDSDNTIHPEFQLLYSIYKNLASMATDRKDYRAAMESYLEAIKIDSSEVTVWFKIGQTALKIEDFQLAQLAFEQGLVCSPKHWPCLDNLITLMYALNNYFDCLYYIAKAFALDLHYEKGHAIHRKIIKEQPSLKDDTAEFYQYFDTAINEYELDSETAKEYVEEALAIRRRKQELSKPAEPERLSFPPKLKAYSWKCIGEEMIRLYDRATTSDPIISICLKMKMPDYTDVPAAGDKPETDKTERKDAPQSGETEGVEDMDIDGENVKGVKKVEKVIETKNVENEKDGKETAMEVDNYLEKVNENKIENVESKINFADGKKIEAESKCDISSDKKSVESLHNEADTKDVDIKDAKQTEKEEGLRDENVKKESLETDQNIKQEVSEKEQNVKEALEKDCKESEESEEVEMESDDSVLEAFKTAQTLLDGLSPCKDGASSLEKKDSVDGITGPVSDGAAKSKEVQDLTETLKEIEKELHVIKDSNARSSGSYESATQGPGVNKHEEPRAGTSGIHGSTIEQNIQKQTQLNKSGSFGFTPSLFPEPSIRLSQPSLPPLTMPSSSGLSARSLPNISPLVMPTGTSYSTRSPLIGHSQLSSSLIGPSYVGSPLDGVSSPMIGHSHPASPLVGHMPDTSPLARQMSSSMPLAGMSSASSPLIGPYPGISPLIGQMSSSLPLAGMPSVSSPVIGPQYNTSPFIGEVSSPLIGSHYGSSPLIGQMSSTSPLAGRSPTGSSSMGPLPTAAGFHGHRSPSSGIHTGYPARTNIITQDHGYTIPALNVIPAPNLNISVSPTSSSNTSPQKQSPILTSYLTYNSSPAGSSQSPMKGQNRSGLGYASMATENKQTGPGSVSPRKLNVPVTQSLHKTLDTAPVPSSLFIADFDDQSPGGRRGQKRKKISMATEEIMMYGKRRSARVRNTGRRKEEETVNYMELLQAFLPSSLKTVQEDEVRETEAKTPDQSKSPVAMETESDKVNVYQDWNEEEEMKKFLHDNVTNYGLMILMRDYLFRVAKFEKCQWKDGLAEVYLSVFSRIRKHLDSPNIFCSEESQENIREFSKVCLLWAELQLDKWLSSSRSKVQGSPGTSPRSQNQIFLHEEDLPYNYNEDTWYIMACCGQSDSLAEFWNEYCIRAYWMKARLNMLLGSTEDAISCFERAKEYLQLAEEEENIQRVFVANIKLDNVITQATVTAIQESLQQSQSVEEIQRLSETGDNAAVVELLLQTFQQPKHKSKFVNKTVDASERQSQLCLLQDTLYKLGDLQKCLLWGEESFNESYEQYQKSTTQGAKSDWLRSMVKIFTAMQRVLEKDLSVVKSLPSVKLVRFTQNLVQMIDTNMSLHESVTDMRIDTLQPWVVLYQLIKHEETVMETLREKETDESDMEENMPSSLMLMNVSHDYLGSRSWCCKSDGAFLMFFLKVLKSKVYSESPLLDDYQQAFEQCVYCLYGHPNRKGKAKHLQDHNAPGVTLHWEEAIDVFEYFKPKSMPEFDGYKHDTISAEMECLLKRILPLIPESSKSTGLSADDIQNYIEGVSTATPDIPDGREITLPVVNEIYYLLADYYLKNKEVGKAIKFYIQDLCINPSRLDSWAGMALARMSQLEQKLSSVELKMDVPVFRRSITALRCFKRAMEIDYSNCKLWIEYGSLAYILHAHASRQLQWKNWFAMKEDFLQIARDSKEEMLQTAHNCFIRAAECCDEGSEEEWIMNYMTGKCLEKMGKSAKEYLPYYKKASEDLHEGGARYPKKIVYAYTTPHYAVEALEMYFRQHISILKLLVKHPPDSPELDYKTYLTYIIQASRSPFAKRIEKGHEIRTDRDSASSADEGSCPGLLSPMKQKNTKYKIPSDDHTYVRQKSNQGIAGTSECLKHSQNQSQEGVTLTSNVPSGSSVSTVTTLELHSEQTSSQEQEMLTTTTAKCPELIIDQKAPLLGVQSMKMADSDGSVTSVSGLTATRASASKPSGEDSVTAFMKTVNDAIDKAVKEELMDSDDTETKSTSVSMEIDNITTKDGGGVKKETEDLTVVSKQEKAETSDQDVIFIDEKNDADEKSPEEKGLAPLYLSTVRSDDKSETKPELSVEEMVAMELSKSREEIHRDLVEMCFRGVELCLKRFPTHYKSHYRLAYIYVHSPYHKNVKKARTILLGAPKWSQFDYMPCQGLFYERKPNKFFQGVWKIPIDEVDRSGSFPAHLNKCISLLLEVLRQDKDPGMLFQIHQNLNRQPEAGKKYLRDAERKFYTLQSFKTTLDAVEAQTNAMKLVTDQEARIKYLMTVYKIREHGVQKLNRDVEKLNRLFAEAYRVALRKLETLPVPMLLSEALRFCKHQHTKKTGTVGGDKNQNAFTSKQLATLNGKPSTVAVTSKSPTSLGGGLTSVALKNIIGPQKLSPGSQTKTAAGLPVQKVSISTPSKTVTAAQKLISLAKISKIGKSQSVGLAKGNKSNNSSVDGTKILKLNLTDIGKGTNSLEKKATGEFVKPKSNIENTNISSTDKKDDVIVLSDESERENSPTKAPTSMGFDDKAKTTSAPAPTVKIKMGLLQLAKLKKTKAPDESKTESDKGKENTEESESEDPLPEDIDMSVDEIPTSSSSSSSSSSSDSSSSDDDTNDDDEEEEDNDEDEDGSSTSSDDNEESNASKSENKSKKAADNAPLGKKCGITVPTATFIKKTSQTVTNPAVAKKPTVGTQKTSKASSIKQSLLMKCKRTVGKSASQKASTLFRKATVSKENISQPTVTKQNVAKQSVTKPYVSKPLKLKTEKIVINNVKANDTDDADDEGVTESEIDDIVILDDSEDDDKSQSLGEDSVSDMDDDDDDDNDGKDDDDDYKASADEPDGSDLDDFVDDNDDVKDADVVMISESESEDEFAPKGRAIIPSPPHSKLKDMEKTVVLVSDMPDVDPIMTSIISSETD